MTTSEQAQLHFVYAEHPDRRADDIGTALFQDPPFTPEVVALELAHIGTTQAQIDQELSRMRKAFDVISDPSSAAAAAKRALDRLGPFYKSCVSSFLGSGVEIVFIDVHADRELSAKGDRFYTHALDRRYQSVVKDTHLSLQARQEEIINTAIAEAALLTPREDLTTRQIIDLGSRASRLAIFQGVAHEAIADLLQAGGACVTRSHVPELRSWSETGAPIYVPEPRILPRYIMNNGPNGPEVSQLVDRTMLCLYLTDYILEQPEVRKQAQDFYGVTIAASRIVRSLDAEKIAGKCRALVRATKSGDSFAKILLPIMPKHSLQVFA